MLQNNSNFKNALGMDHDFTLFVLETQVTACQNCLQQF